MVHPPYSVHKAATSVAPARLSVLGRRGRLPPSRTIGACSVEPLQYLVPGLTFRNDQARKHSKSFSMGRQVKLLEVDMIADGVLCAALMAGQGPRNALVRRGLKGRPVRLPNHLHRLQSEQ